MLIRSRHICIRSILFTAILSFVDKSIYRKQNGRLSIHVGTVTREYFQINESRVWFCISLLKCERGSDVNSIKKFKCTLQVGLLFFTNSHQSKSLQVPVRSLKLALTMVFYWIQSVISQKFTCTLCSCTKPHL